MADETVVPPERIQRLGTLMQARCARSIVPIYVQQYGTLRQHGTGLLLGVAEKVFMVTASHVITSAKEYGLPLLLADSPGGVPCPLPGGRVAGFDGDALDVAVFELLAETVARFDGLEFLRLSDLCLTVFERSGVYFWYGFPSAWNPAVGDGEILEQKFLGFFSVAHEDNVFRESYDSRHHILISAAKDTARSTDGQPVAPPAKLSGISGAAIWKVCSELRVPTDWTPEAAKIVAIETMVYGKSHEIVRGTHAGAIVSLLWRAFPELHKVIEWHAPALAEYERA